MTKYLKAKQVVFFYFCKINLRVLYVITQTQILPFFMGVCFSGVYIFHTIPVIHHTSLLLLIYNLVGNTFLACYFRNPIALKKAELFIGKDFLYSNLSNSVLGEKGFLIAVAAFSFGARAFGQYAIREQVQRHKIEASDRLADMSRRAGNDGELNEAYRLRQASANVLMAPPSPFVPDPSPTGNPLFES